MSDPVRRAFLERFRRDAAEAHRESDCLRFLADPRSGDPPERYFGLFFGVQHFERRNGGGVGVSDGPIPFTIELPLDYLQGTDATLQGRVARVHAPLLHPNASRLGGLCLGDRFRPATRCRPLLEHVHRIVSARVFATHHPLDLRAARWYVAHLDEVRALRSSPLWNRRTAARVIVGARGGS